MIILDTILKNIPKQVTLVAVSKNFSNEETLTLYKQGQKIFGENKVQELANKNDFFKADDINWHFIGRLQSNKINSLLKLPIKLWQSCNSFELAYEVNKRSDRKIDALLQINSANENSKQGIHPDLAIEEFCKIKEHCKNINLIGVMSIGAMSDDKKEIQKSFKLTYKIFEELKNNGANICSMGMSNDYQLAIDCGSTMIRLGSILK